ncbi:MAG: hypothetical protein AAF485_24810, partial [Chloroflexota bacterium]
MIIKTKIVVPRRKPDLLVRPRLIDLFFDLLDNQLLLVNAPAGYGKTSLLIEMAHQLEMPVCWLSVDSSSRNLTQFLDYFIASIEQMFPNSLTQARTILENTVANLDLDQLVAVIVNEIYDKIQEYVTIIIDDYHLLDNNSEISYFFNQFTQNVSENCHTVISSRTLPLLPDLTLMKSRSQVAEIQLEDLAFTKAELQALAQQSYGATVSEAEAETLVQTSEGWITGLMLSARTKWAGVV